ncbi:MAG: type II toxin-antitoxin system HicB family antitoxin [Clostridia bacterium]|nr:type II toxin-antitoxin system HicB family antitoxin [Clostridia bacterium]
MMDNIMEYKGYYGSVNYSQADDVLHGKLLGIKSLVSYEGSSIKELKEDFEFAVDDYLQMCKDEGMEPEKPFDTEIILKLDPEVWLKASMAASSENIPLAKLIELTLKEKLQAYG